MTQLLFPIPASIWISANDRPHWADKSRRTKALRLLGRAVAQQERVPEHDVTHVAAFIAFTRNGRADPANAAPTVKALIDGMVDAGVWPDDDSTHVIGPTYLRDPSTGNKGEYRVRLVLTRQEIPW